MAAGLPTRGPRISTSLFVGVIQHPFRPVITATSRLAAARPSMAFLWPRPLHPPHPAAPAPAHTWLPRAAPRGMWVMASADSLLSRAKSRVSSATGAFVGGTLLVSRGHSPRGLLLASWPDQVGGVGRPSDLRSGGVLLWASTVRGSSAAAGAAGASQQGQQPAVVVVESPTKAKKIQGFLGDNYKVLASYGHVRDLSSREGSVRPDQDFALTWSMLPLAGPRLEEIAGAASGSPLLLLATDPDREGEAISWHIEQELRRRGVLERVGAVRRITFTEITRNAITAAIGGGRQISQELVDAYLARRALDYLVGFHLSPVLWRKLPKAKSAGRVQSVALRLVCEREAAVERFTPTPYWSIAVQLAVDPAASAAAASSTHGSLVVGARLTHVDGRRLGSLDINSSEMADQLAARIMSGPVAVSRVSQRQVQRQPLAPFTTASLQQEAARRLGFGTARTMKVAQQLYEGAGTGEGLITYMRTDGVQLSGEAVEELRRTNETMYGKDAVPEQPRHYKSRAKNAQEAHEAIRPTRPDLMTPSSLPSSLDPDQRALYELIWRRAVASQMTNAVYDIVTVEFAADGGSLTLRSSGSHVTQLGFLRAYADPAAGEETEDPGEGGYGRQLGRGPDGGSGDGEEEEEALLGPALAADSNRGAAAEQLLQLRVGMVLSPGGPVQPTQHWTRPPARYTEASLVRALEERGIGRPSTYAPVISLLQDRGYVTREGRSLLPSSLGRVLTAFLEHYFGRLVDVDFTSQMEQQLDEVAAGKAAWRSVLTSFWSPFSAAVTSMSAISTTQVYNMLDTALASHFFRTPATTAGAISSSSSSSSGNAAIDVQATTVAGGTATANAATTTPAATDPRVCPKCHRGRLVIKPSRYGGFIGCSLYSDEAVCCDYARPLRRLETSAPGAGAGGDGDSCDPAGSPINSDGEGGPVPGSVFTSSPSAAFAAATERLLGRHPETGEPVWVRLGPYGLYVQLGDAPPKKKAGGKKAATARRGRKPKTTAATVPAVEAAAESGVEAEGAAATQRQEEEVEKEEEETVEAAPKPRRAQIPKSKGVTLQSVSLDQALALLALPRTLGPHPEDGRPVVASTGPFGPYLSHNGLTVSLGKWTSPQEVDLDMAVKMLAAKRARQTAGEVLGLAPARGRWRGAGTGRGTRGRSTAGKAAGTTGAKAAAAPRSKSGYSLYLQQRWQEIKAAEAAAGGTTTPYRQAVSRIAAEWREMGEEGQSRFDAEAATVSEAAEAAEEQPAQVSAAPAAVAPSSPSRSNPYLRFCAVRRPALRAAYPGASLVEISRLLGAEWGALGEAQKAAFR